MGRKRMVNRIFYAKAVVNNRFGDPIQSSYQYAGAKPANKDLMRIMLLRNCGLRDIETILGVSRYSVLRTLEVCGQSVEITTRNNHYKSLQLDELWTYVGKVWLLYAYSPDDQEIVAYVTGDRSAKTVERLYQKLEQVEVEQFCTDHWPAFQKVLPAAKHKVGKEFTKHIEGVNTCLRARNRRLVRKTTGPRGLVSLRRKKIMYWLSN